MSEDFSGKVALVTGAGSGIGEASAKRLAAEGAWIAALDVSVAGVERVCSEIAASGGKAIAVVADVADEAQMRGGIEAAVAATGRIDIVVHCAGINGVWAPIDELMPDEWDRTIAINLRGTYLTLHLAVPHLKAAGGGSIVIISSINGSRVFSTAGATAYSASKAAQLAVANQLALELARHKIRVNTVLPGTTKTGIGANTLRRNTDSVRYPIVWPEGDIPLNGKPAASDDIAEAVLFLASDRSGHITGTPIYIDAGQSLIR